MNGRGCKLASIDWKLALYVFSVLIAAGLSGCGNDLSQVSGVVTLDGQPLRGSNDVRATVTFQPISNAGTTAVGLLDEYGQYQLSTGSEEGVLPGEYYVTCSATQLVRGPDGTTAGGRRITPLNYASTKTSGFKFTVVPGNNEYDLALDSRGAGRAQP